MTCDIGVSNFSQFVRLNDNWLFERDTANNLLKYSKIKCHKNLNAILYCYFISVNCIVLGKKDMGHNVHRP